MNLTRAESRNSMLIRLVVILSALILTTAPVFAQDSQQRPADQQRPTDQQRPADERQPTEPRTNEQRPIDPTASPTIPDASKEPAAPVNPKTYKIGAEDVIHILVWHDNDWTRSHIVRPDGKITLPLVGDIQAAGLTPEELSKNVAEALSKYINNPEVSVTVVQVNSKKYYITGEVIRPGSFPLVTPTRVLEALTNAGGFREFANTKKIVILRNGKRLRFNYKEVIHGKNLDQNIYLEDGDYIIVP